MLKHNFEEEMITIEQNSPYYPSNLKKIIDSPKRLYALGNIELLNGNNIAIVGTRKASENGKNIAYSFAQNLCNNNITIVSGLASRH